MVAIKTDIDINDLLVKQSVIPRGNTEIKYETTPESVESRTLNTINMKRSIDSYRKVEALDMVNVKLQALNILTHPAKLQEASMDELMKLVKLANDRQQLIEGKPQTTQGTLIACIMKAADIRKMDSSDIINIGNEDEDEDSEEFSDELIDSKFEQ